MSTFNPSKAIKRMERKITTLETDMQNMSCPANQHHKILGANAMLEILKDEVIAQQPRPIPSPRPDMLQDTRSIREKFEDESV